MATLEHTPTSTERDTIEGDYEKPRLTQTISSGAVSMSPELFEKVGMKNNSVDDEYVLIVSIALPHAENTPCRRQHQTFRQSDSSRFCWVL